MPKPVYLLPLLLVCFLQATATPPAQSLSLAALADKAGLPYPDEGYAGPVFIKQAFVFLDVQSRWGQVQGYQPWHSVTIKHTARYVLANSGSQTTAQIRMPLMVTSLELRVNGVTVNSSSVEDVRGPEEGAGVIYRIFTLTVEVPANGDSTLEVQALQLGASPLEAEYTYYMVNSSRWAQPVESFDVVFQVDGGALTSSTITPTTAGQTGASWSLANLSPSNNLDIKWAITEPQPPFQPLSTGDATILILGASLAVAVATAAIAVHLLRRRKTRVETRKQTGPSGTHQLS